MYDVCKGRVAGLASEAKLGRARLVCFLLWFARLGFLGTGMVR